MQLRNNSALQNGKYRIIRVLGQGGFGITYLAENVLLDKKVAIKEFFPKEYCDRDSTSRLTLGTQNNAETVAKLKDRFLKEAKNIAKLDHPGIVKIHDVFEENNTAYYVMDYIEGENLNEMVKRIGPLSEAKAIEYIRKVGDALDYIHARNMTHFDVKPANIVVRREDDQPVLIDFGLSKQYNSNGDATSTLMQGVSQGYSPIELYTAGTISTFSPQTDIYSLGATLVYLLTGSVPPSASQIIENGLTIPAKISSSIKEAIKFAMQTSRSKRPSIVSSFCNKLYIERPNSDDSKTQFSDEETRFINQSRTKQSSSNNKPYQNEARYTQLKNKNTKVAGFLIPAFVIFIIGLIIYGIDTYRSNDIKGDEMNKTSEIKQVKDSIVEVKVQNMFFHSVLGDCSYTGEVDEDNRPHGNGVAVWRTGDGIRYDGEWVHGNMEGKTKYTQRSGDTFEGEFKDNKYYKGTYTIKSTGEYFIGSFKNGQPDSGVWYDKNGNLL